MGSFQHGALSRTLLLLLSVLALSVSSDRARAETQVRVLSACEDAADFAPARTPDDPGFDFSAWEATVFAGASVTESSIRWHMYPSSAAQSSARLALTRPVTGIPRSIGLWVKNPNAHDLAFHLEIIDGDGARYVSPPVALLEEIGWREITFDLADMTGPEDDPSAGIDAPLVRIAFVVDGLDADRPHTIYLDEITAVMSDLSELAVTNLRCQTSLGPGESLSVRAEVSPADAAGRSRITAELASVTGGAVAWAPARIAEGDGERAALTATLRVPRWIAPGRYEVRLTSDHAEFAHMEPIGVVIGGAAAVPLRGAIVAGLSPPAIRLGETDLRPVVEELQGRLPSALSEGVRIVGLPATVDAHPFAWAPGVLFDAEGEPDFGALDRRAAAVLDARPGAALVLQVFADATSEWKDAHPGHLVQFGGGQLAPPRLMAGDRRHPDLVSATWQTDAEARLRALVRHVERSPWGHRVVGYELQAGDHGAWRPWGASLGLGDDTTQLREQAFLDWLHRRYPDVGELRGGWLGRRRGFGRPGAGFESVQIPTPLTDAPEPSLYDPSADQPMIDLLHFRAEATADAMLAMARAVRDEASAGTLVGASYGHLLAQARANDWAWPHTALSRVLEDDALDFLTGPLVRTDDPVEPSSLGESVRRGGKLYIERGRDAAADSGLMAPAGTAGELTRLPEPRGPSVGATVIEVIDDLSARYLSGDGALPRELLARPIAASIPHETYLLRDFLRPNPPQGRIYVFRNVFTIEPEMGRLLARNTARDGSLLVWVYAPGAIDQHLITGRTMQYLTGIKLAPMAKRARVTVRPETGMLSPFGFPGPISPVFFSADERAEWLGTMGDGDPARCGFALRKFEHCTSVFSVAPPTEEVLRHLARRTGIELPSAAD